MSATQANIAFMIHRECCEVCRSDGFRLCKEGLELIREFGLAIDEAVTFELGEMRRAEA